ncbi:substrate-binding domain-containing protein [Patulibacter minatonensis]|uniref:substrate-binding domain-containing protein n=1 Tax=Patulibacter minatonensis TaxID=298163 RepID=UPI00047A1E68|nr:substrate-binding domain-containing protein [Patulibacter minatonensis]
MSARRVAVVALAAGSVALTACGSDEQATRPPLVVDGHPTIVLQASKALSAPLASCTKDYAPAEVRLQTGDDTQITARLKKRTGDLVATDGTTLLDELAGDGVVEQPEAFARDELVLAVPGSDAKVRTLEDLTRGESGALIAIGAASTALGASTNAMLERLEPVEREAVLARVRTTEPDGPALVARLRNGTLDAAFVHASDVQSSAGDVRAIPLPAALEPGLTYDAAVVKNSPHAADAAALLDDLQRGTCAGALRAAGYMAP